MEVSEYVVVVLKIFRESRTGVHECIEVLVQPLESICKMLEELEWTEVDGNVILSEEGEPICDVLKRLIEERGLVEVHFDEEMYWLVVRCVCMDVKRLVCADCDPNNPCILQAGDGEDGKSITKRFL